MATGEVAGGPAQSDAEPGSGEAVMDAGRLSIARRVEPDAYRLPFSPTQLERIDEALVLSSRSTGLEFAIYLGGLGEDSRARAEELHAGLGEYASPGVLIAVSPGQRTFEIVTGEEAHRRITDRSCQLAAMSMMASFQEGELTEGLVSGLRMLADAAGQRSDHPE
ncbi:DUF5130 family protein [Salinifilum ghardaiensis]